MADLKSLADFLQADALPQFSPRPYYERKSDSLIFYLRNRRSYSKRLNTLLTLFVDVTDDSLTGVEVKGVARILKIVKAFGVTVIDHKIKLGAFLAFALAEEPEDPNLEQRYCEDLRLIKDEEVDAEELAAA